MTALAISPPSPYQTLHTLFTAKGAPLNRWMTSAKAMNAPLQTALTTAHLIAMSPANATQANVETLLAASKTNAQFQDILAAAQPRGSPSNSIFAATMASPSGSDPKVAPSSSACGQPCLRHLTSRSCRPGLGRGCRFTHYESDNKAPSNLLATHKAALGKVSRPRDLSETRCPDAGIPYKVLYDILAEPRSQGPARLVQPGIVCGLFSARKSCKQGHCIGNCRVACPCAVPGPEAHTCGTPPLACATVRKQLELLSLDQRTSEATIALTLLRAPVPQIVQTTLPVTSASPFAFAVSASPASVPTTTTSAFCCCTSPR